MQRLYQKQPIIESAANAAERQVDMMRLTFLFLLAVVTLCHAPSAMAHLHPNLQRFVQRDPAGYVDSSNIYAYARALPTLHRDPSGLCAAQATDQECCAIYFKQNPEIRGGKLTCCFGRPVACSKFPPKSYGGNDDSNQIVEACSREHESDHRDVMGSVGCSGNPTAVYEAPNTTQGGDQAAEECGAYKVELACVQARLRGSGVDGQTTCDQSADPETCRIALDERVRRIKWYIHWFCELKKPNQADPPPGKDQWDPK